MLRIIWGVPVGVVLWLAVRYADRALDRYSQPKFPEYPGPKYYQYKNGVQSPWTPDI